MDNLTYRLTNLSPAKRALLELRLKTKGTAAPSEQTIPRRPTCDPAPLSFAQQRLWFLNQMEPESPAYNQPKAIRLIGSLDVNALQKALDQIIARHEVLRTTFVSVDGMPLQVIADSRAVALPVIDLGAESEAARDAEVKRLLAETIRRPFDLSRDLMLRALLLRLHEAEHILLLVTHHIASDGWSTGVLHRELSALYQAFAAGEPPRLPELPVQYADFAVWQRQWLQGKTLDAQLAYWKKQLKLVPALELPSDRPRPLVQSFRGGRQFLVLSKDLSEGLKSLSRREGVTLFMILLAAFHTLLHRYTGQDDITVGSPIAGRTRAEIEGLIGFFVNTLVLRTDLSGNPSFRQLLDRVREVALGAYAHQDLPFEKLVEELQPERNLSHSPLFQVMFALQNVPRVAIELPGLTLSSMTVDSGTAKFDLFLSLHEETEALRGSLEYNTDLFDDATIHRMLNHFENLLKAVVANPDQRISGLALLTEGERHQVLVEWNATATDYPKDKPIHELFEAQAERSPDAVAVVFPLTSSGHGKDKQLTYRELNIRANTLAHRLKKLGVGPEVRVGICVERSLEMVVGLLGILKAGGAYVPLDPAYPKERLAFMLEDAQVSVLLTQERLVKELIEDRRSKGDGDSRSSILDPRFQVICLDADWELITKESEENPIGGATADTLAYLIYTSGSTGTPKGVEVLHRGIVRLLFGVDYVELNATGTFLQLAPLAFDASTLEIWGALLHGARLVLSPEKILTHQELSHIIQKQGVSTLWLTASLFNSVIDDVPDALSGIRQLLIGGEALSFPHVQRGLELLPSTQIINGYGPTESTTFTCCYRIPKQMDKAVTSVPIGRPITNTQVYLLDHQLNPVPIGVPGELYIGGDGLARGYLNQPELTAEKFIPDPFNNEVGARLYKTGDRARYLPDGNIEFLGRIDCQVKIRGFRIELGEIEAVLGQHPAVRQAVVLAREDVPGDLSAPLGTGKRLVAYVAYSPRSDNSPEQASRTGLWAEHVSQWQTIFDGHIYQNFSPDGDPTFNIAGWKNSYDGKPILKQEMHKWLDDTVEQIRRLQPRRVLEIGCGTGLLLFRIAPFCAQYWGTDFSQVALDYIRHQLDRQDRPITGVTLLQRAADQFEGIEKDAFDAVVLNSVVQYFPDIDYLYRVLEGAVNAVAPGGFIFVGDVRSLPLLEAFHASVQLFKAESSLPLSELQQRVKVHMAQENELVIDPAFFLALKQRFPKIGRVEILPKRGRSYNELTRFRYQVILYLAPEDSARVASQWLDWQNEGLTLDSVRRLLVEEERESLVITRVPNARLSEQVQILKWLANPDEILTVGELRERLQRAPKMGVDPEDLFELSDELPYSIRISWARHGFDGCYVVMFRRRATDAAVLSGLEFPTLPKATIHPKPWSEFANNPLQDEVARNLVPQLRAFLQQKLPDYMIPAVFVLLDALPLSPNGKVHRRALPAPERTRPSPQTTFVAPQDRFEFQLTQIWEMYLGIKPIGVRDNFFELGGHSLLAVRLFAEIEKTFGKNLPLSLLFQAPTVQQLASVLRQKEWREPWSSLVPIQPGGSKPPLYLIHAGGGEILFYSNLAHHLGPDQPVYGLRAQGLDGDQPPLSRVEDMATQYIKEIQSLQPEGPYIMGGYCLGGNVAVEMAQQLYAQGQKASAIILDSGWVDLPTLTRDPPRKSTNYYIRRFVYHWQRRQLTDALLSDALYYLRKTVAKVSYMLSSREDRRRQRIINAHKKARSDYVPKVYPGRITLFRSEEFHAREDKHSHLKWSELAGGGFEYHVVPGTHITMVQEPHVQILAEKMMACLQEAQTADSGKQTLLRYGDHSHIPITSATKDFSDRE